VARHSLSSALYSNHINVLPSLSPNRMRPRACVRNGFKHCIRDGGFNADLLPVVHPYCAGRARRHPGARADVEPVVLALPAGVGPHGIPVHQWSWASCLPPYLCGSTVAGIGGNSISHPFRWREPLMNRTLGLSSPHSSGPVYHAFLRYEAILRGGAEATQRRGPGCSRSASRDERSALYDTRMLLHDTVDLRILRHLEPLCKG
jgi:hypothetical protein